MTPLGRMIWKRVTDIERNVRRIQRHLAYADYMKSPEWQVVRATVMLRAKGRCEECKRATARSVHHKTYPANLFDTEAKHCKAVCAACHRKLDKQRTARR